MVVRDSFVEASGTIKDTNVDSIKTALWKKSKGTRAGSLLLLDLNDDI